MTKRIVAIAFIFVCATIAWAILGGTIFSRTYDSSTSSSNRVESTWGTSQNQGPPTATFKTVVSKQKRRLRMEKKTVKTIQNEYSTALPLEASKIDVDLNLEHRQKDFCGTAPTKLVFGFYTFQNTSDKEAVG